MHTVHAARDLSASAAKVYEYLSDHQRFGILFAPARFEHVSDGKDARAGVGSVRKISFWGLLPFYETIQVTVPNERIEYAITKGSPLRNHRGILVLSELPNGGSRIDYTISFDAPPGLGAAVASGLRRRVPAGLDRLEAATAG